MDAVARSRPVLPDRDVCDRGLRTPPRQGRPDRTFIIGIKEEGGQTKTRGVRVKIGMKDILGRPVACIYKHLCGIATDLSRQSDVGDCWWLSLFNPRLNDKSIGLR
jgi:hypothetical protein